MENTLIEKQLKAAADLNRIKLLAYMKYGEVCVCDFVDVLEISQPAVSQHLRKLKEAGIITERKVGTWKHYRLVEEQTPLMIGILEQIEPLNGCNCGSDCTHIGEGN
ncbi:ArsR/SmtB family transcription factor [Lysinibacillus fusiformis]|uniref:ArsR/SmtB family transcription factor n=1 Tax=Lysinibacillus fusiformis TaxID=28031 RepID=UPI0012465E1A|nr:metalloregulator ArsR/SmtB family transcription factor [Lysinibacillus fusiformis]KAB0444252.1 transcriptional regulator [Lysinibacillus fusiformis]